MSTDLWIDETPSSEEMQALGAVLAEVHSAAEWSESLDEEIGVGLARLKQRGKIVTYSPLALARLIVSTREQQITLLEDVNRAVLRTQAG